MDQGNFVARVKDCISICRRTNAPKFLGFLSAEEVAKAEPILKKSDVKYRFFGGFPLAERRCLGVFPDWCENAEFPFDAVTFTYPKAYHLTHRDFLGAIMSLKISRESVGDILVGEGNAVIFLSKTVVKHVLSEIKKVGAVGVEGKIDLPEVLPEVSSKVSLRDTVASKRLDCIVSAIAGTSRSMAITLVSAGKVSVNSVLCQKPTRTVTAGDNITIRGRGRFTVEAVDDISRKGRIILIYSKFV